MNKFKIQTQQIKETTSNLSKGTLGIETSTAKYILTNDPSMTAWGWAVIEPISNTIMDSGVIKTTPEHKKLRIRKGDDTIRRIDEIGKKLLAIVRTFNIKFIVSELPHGSQNAQAAVMLGIVTGILETISICTDIPIEWYSEMDAKKSLFNKKVVSKSDTIQKISEIYGINFKWPKYQNEAVADAMAIYHAAELNSEVIKWMKK